MADSSFVKNLAMAARKLPYYRMESSLMPFRPIRWQQYAGSQGYVPLATQRGVSLERPAPGAAPLPPLTHDGLEFVVDTREGMLSKYRKTDVYFPIFNKTYNAWREKHQRGGDFMIYSSPVRMKLNRPIYIELDTICRPPEPMY